MELRDIDLLKHRVRELEREVHDLTRHNRELRETVDALMRPAPSELLTRNFAHPSRRMGVKNPDAFA